MRRWIYVCLLLVWSGAVGAQQKPQQPAPPATPPSPTTDSQSPDSVDGLSRDKTFPGDRPGSGAPNAAPANSEPAAKRTPGAPSMEPPRSDRVRADDLEGVGVSSSRDTQVDLSPPEDDAKVHPKSSAAVADAEAEMLDRSGVGEFHTWDPHKAAKSIEVGDYYFKRKNYRAAEDRYREALRYKDNDAVATIRLAVCLEKLGIFDDARAEYESYLKILPHGPQAVEAQKAIDRLKGPTAARQP